MPFSELHITGALLKKETSLLDGVGSSVTPAKAAPSPGLTPGPALPASPAHSTPLTWQHAAKEERFST